MVTSGWTGATSAPGKELGRRLAKSTGGSSTKTCSNMTQGLGFRV